MGKFYVDIRRPYDREGYAVYIIESGGINTKSKLYNKIEDGILVVATGEGKIVDSFDNRKDMIAPGDRYFHLSRIDSAWFHNNGTALFYNNYLYEDGKASVSLGKMRMNSEVLKTFGNVLRTKEELFALSNRPGWQQE